MPEIPVGAASAAAAAPEPVLVSVLVRSMARPSLGAALASVASQTHRPIEIVVVNAGAGQHPPLPDDEAGLTYRLIDAREPLPRAQAANAALRAAWGAWLLFLDDDDTLDSDHLARLVAAVRANPGTRVAHADVRLIDSEGRSQGVLDEAVGLPRLWCSNRLAIHAVLFDRRWVDEGLRFDETFSVYEDWDFWFQIARCTTLLHVPGASATYRLTGDSGASVPHDPTTSRALRLPFYAKWLPMLSSAELEALTASAEHARGDLGAARQQLVALSAQRDAAQAAALQVERQAQALEGKLAHVRSDLAHVRSDLAHVQSDLAHVRSDLTRVRTTYAELERGYLAVTRSLSWRSTAILRRLRGLVGAQEGVDLPHRIWRALPMSNARRLSLRSALLEHRWGRAVARGLAPRLLPAPARSSPLPAPSPSDKECVRADAEAGLTAFLEGSLRIVLPRSAQAPAVSVIVVLFNQAGLSRLCLESLARSEDVDFETLLVDNGSTDRVPALLARVDGAEVLRPGENLGFLRAVNLAAKRARGRYVLMLNNDAVVEPDTLRCAVARLDGDAGIGAVGGPILLWDGRLQEAGSIIWRDGSCQGWGRGEDPTRPEFQFMRDVDYCSGAFLMVRRSLFEALGGLDEAFAPAYYEETDFCARLWEQGQRVVYDPAVRIRHFEFASEVSSGWAIELQRRHRTLFVQRHAAFLADQHALSAQSGLRARARLRAGRVRVLVIDDRVPLPWLGQGYPRAASLVAAMVREGHAVTHYPLQFPSESWASVRRALPETVEVLLDHGLPALRDLLEARRGFFDIVIVSRPHNMQALRRLLDAEPGLLGSARLIYDAEAMFALRDIARAALEGRPLTDGEQAALIDSELSLARTADSIVAVSTAEAAHYRKAGHANVHVLGHEIEASPGTPGFASRAGFLFLGAMVADDTPNSDSVQWFVEAVWPHVRARLRNAAVLHLVGSCEASRIKTLASDDVIIHGRVESIASHLDAARVFVVPTRFAAGIPHKAHEAAARGLPMVVTPLIAEQLGWDDIVAVGESAQAFGQHCVDLHVDEARWQKQRAAILSAIGRDASRAAFSASLKHLLNAPGPTLAAPPAISTEAASSLTVDEQRTADLWGRNAAQREDPSRQRRHWSSHPVTAAEINRLISGDPAVGWVAHLKRSRFPSARPRGLSLGCGSGAVVVDALQLGIVHEMEGVDISEGAVAVAVASERAARAGLQQQARFRAANVNALKLDGPLDLIVFEQSLHHVNSLDAVLDRCHDALAPDGLLVINEYVGADRFQWSETAQRLMNAVLGTLPDWLRRDPDHGTLRTQMRRVTPQEVIDVDPSEAIHSSRILEACALRFEIVELRRFGGTLLQFLLADIAANFDPCDDRDAALLRLMTLLETELIQCGVVESDFVYAVYRRRRRGMEGGR